MAVRSFIIILRYDSKQKILLMENKMEMSIHKEIVVNGKITQPIAQGSHFLRIVLNLPLSFRFIDLCASSLPRRYLLMQRSRVRRLTFFFSPPDTR